MPKIKIVSWNVNGLRAILKKGFMDWYTKEKPDVLCLQETKLSDISQLDITISDPETSTTLWNCAMEKKGYSGTAMISLLEPKEMLVQFDEEILNKEGRMTGMDFGDFILFNVYFPNGKMGPHRLNFKMEFYEAFLRLITSLTKAGREVVFCGDVNTAHREIDLARPKENSKVSGFLPTEREWLDKVEKSGFIDVFRRDHAGEVGHYTWWDTMTRARERNVGWRIDYFWASSKIAKKIKTTKILSNVMGSDHCPILIELERLK